MKLFVKYMVSERCKMAVKAELRKMGLHFVFIEFGQIETMSTLTENQIATLKKSLGSQGLVLVDNTKAELMRQMKANIDMMIHDFEVIPKSGFPSYLLEKLGEQYKYLSGLFCDSQGITVTQYIIEQKVNLTKRMLLHENMSVNAIAEALNYDSVDNLTRQFKELTGLSPEEYQSLKK